MPKTAFLASSTIPPDMVLRCYDWATEKHDGCIVSGFSSKLEQDVLHFLIASKQPIIMVLARQMYTQIAQKLQSLIDEHRLLIISVSDSVRQSKATALARNKYVCEIAEQILFVGVTENSSLYPLYNFYSQKTIFF